MAVAIDDDDTAIAAQLGNLVEGALSRLPDSVSCQFNAGANGLGNGNANEILAVPGGRDRADPVLGIGRRADKR